MIREAGCLAIIPARGGSKGLPGKNVAMLGGKPMIQHTIEAALNSECVAEVVVSTDSTKIAEVSLHAGAAVPFIRPAELATDEAKSIDVLIHAVHYYEQEQQRSFEYIMLLQPTSPLRTTKDIEQAFSIFQNHQADSLQSVTSSHTHPYLLRTFTNEQLKPYLKEESSHLRRQELQDIYVLNGAIYIMNRSLLMDRYRIVGEHNCGYVMPKERSIDIDNELDLKFAQLIWDEYNN
ncbi:acylneuraminate cytidylyltransferase family protein [Paenibacillus wulumuqiensis]|uniref:acylneuraminate cytidylyltransferase family protein n=1 Tax=Paenibacillus wulumuqiensis TaxID=1567107 RepID=UPI000619A67C|nr:acylneuraminate cytidylyltransferase family protein [Paenibacillus wulumuqiensis]